MSFLFQGQRPNEDVILVTRQHPLVLAKPTFFTTLIFLIPIAWFSFFGSGIVASILVIIALVWLVFRYLSEWFSWRNTLMLLTSERLVFVTQVGFFGRELAEVPLVNIQQASHQVEGIMHTTFGYGSIEVSINGMQKPMRIPNVPDPYSLQQEILRVQQGDVGEVLQEEFFDPST